MKHDQISDPLKMSTTDCHESCPGSVAEGPTAVPRRKPPHAWLNFGSCAHRGGITVPFDAFTGPRGISTVLWGPFVRLFGAFHLRHRCDRILEQKSEGSRRAEPPPPNFGC